MISDVNYKNAHLVWDYLQMKHELHPCSVGIALGGHDAGVAHYAADLYQRGMFPTLVVTGAASPTTAPLYPRGEAVEFAAIAQRDGVPASAILIEPRATNTGQNVAFARELLAAEEIRPQSVLMISMPSMERRAYATCRKQWPDVEVLCTSAPQPFHDYIANIGDELKVVANLVGDMQRVIEYPKIGFQIEQEIPNDVLDAYRQLVESGFNSRLI